MWRWVCSASAMTQAPLPASSHAKSRSAAPSASSFCPLKPRWPITVPESRSSAESCCWAGWLRAWPSAPKSRSYDPRSTLPSIATACSDSSPASLSAGSSKTCSAVQAASRRSAAAVRPPAAAAPHAATGRRTRAWVRRGRGSRARCHTCDRSLACDRPRSSWRHGSRCRRRSAGRQTIPPAATPSRGGAATRRAVGVSSGRARARPSRDGLRPRSTAGSAIDWRPETDAAAAATTSSRSSDHGPRSAAPQPAGQPAPAREHSAFCCPRLGGTERTAASRRRAVSGLTGAALRRREQAVRGRAANPPERRRTALPASRISPCRRAGFVI